MERCCVQYVCDSEKRFGQGKKTGRRGISVSHIGNSIVGLKAFPIARVRRKNLDNSTFEDELPPEHSREDSGSTYLAKPYLRACGCILWFALGG